MAARTSRFEPVTETGLSPIPLSGRMSQPNVSLAKASILAAPSVPSSSSFPA